MFDNIEFCENIKDTEDLFLQDLERYRKLHDVDKCFDEEQESATYGNRNYLMLIHQYFEAYSNSSSASNDPAKKEIDSFKSAIMALQCGDTQNMDTMVEKICQPLNYQRASGRGLKDYLWVRFRATA